jgi:hypothetical protein
MESFLANFSNYKGLDAGKTSPLSEFHWWNFKRQNTLMLDALNNSGFVFQVMDAYDINILQTDLHRFPIGDCLHSCYPGKMDVYSQLLSHLLQLLREAA